MREIAVRQQQAEAEPHWNYGAYAKQTAQDNQLLRRTLREISVKDGNSTAATGSTPSNVGEMPVCGESDGNPDPVNWKLATQCCICAHTWHPSPLQSWSASYETYIAEKT